MINLLTFMIGVILLTALFLGFGYLLKKRKTGSGCCRHIPESKKAKKDRVD
jgi:hypothetical protein